MSVTVTIPTAINIKMRFPEFEDVENAVIEFAIEEARDEVGSNWKRSYNLAIVYLTAHYVASAIAASDGGGTTSDIASESIGRFSISYVKAFEGASHVDQSTTSYGKRYLELLERNFGGPVIV